MDDRFFTACFPGGVRVCGRSLVDFSAWHYVILRAIDSPFLRPDGINHPGDLLAAVRACQHRFGDAVELRPTLRDAVWAIRMRRNESLFHEHAKRFAEWMQSHNQGPRFWTVLDGGQRTRDLTGPEILTLLVPIMMKTGMSESDVWDMSLGRAQWLNAEIQEIEGSERRFLFDSDLMEEEAPDA